MSLSRKVQTYIGVITAAAMYFVVTGSVGAQAWDWQNLTIWSIVCVLSELLWLPTISNQATVSMASTFNLAVIYLLGWERSLWVIAASTLFANLAIQKKEWYKALFNVGQSVLSAAAAGIAFRSLGGEVLLPDGPGSHVAQIAEFLSRFNNLNLILPFLVSGLLYQVINTFLVSGVIAIKDNHNVLMIWRQNYGYSTEIVSSVALMLLAPLVVLSYGAISFTGIILFFLPLVFIRDASLRYIELQRAQKTLIASEVMAAKGEMAASIGHELNNYLAAISGRAQMILMLVPPDAEPRLRKSAEIIWETMTDMSKLTIGLMEVGNTAMEKRPSLLNELVLKTVEFVRVQNRFDDIRFSLDLDDTIPKGDLDPGQIQQVFMNLFFNAADAIHESGNPDKLIRAVTRFDAAKNAMRLSVTDTGTGMTPEVKARIFDINYTTKGEKGHGLGLATTFRIVKNHGGEIQVDTEPGKGSTFHVVLPVQTSAAPPVVVRRAEPKDLHKRAS